MGRLITTFPVETSPVADFEWNSDIETGHMEMDDEHKRLLLLCEAVVEPLTNSPEHKPDAAPLRALIDFAQVHFTFEEGLMRSAGYPGADQHARYHASLLAELRTYCFQVQRNLHPNPVGLICFLRNWVILDIDSADRKLVDWLRSHESDGGR